MQCVNICFRFYELLDYGLTLYRIVVYPSLTVPQNTFNRLPLLFILPTRWNAKTRSQINVTGLIYDVPASTSVEERNENTLFILI